MELLATAVTYTEPGRKMSARGTIDTLGVELKAERALLRAQTTVTGTIAGHDLEVEIDDDAIIGIWGGQPAEFELIKKKRDLLVDGYVLGDKVELLLTARLGFRYTAMRREDPLIDLLVDGDQPRLTLSGEVERAIDAAVLAVVVPTLKGMSITAHGGAW